MTGLILAAATAITYCQNIRDSDLRNYCKGESGRPSSCLVIRQSSLRNKCLALARGQKSYCLVIRESDLRNACKAEVDAAK
jgi:hypothetical protein